MPGPVDLNPPLMPGFCFGLGPMPAASGPPGPAGWVNTPGGDPISVPQPQTGHEYARRDARHLNAALVFFRLAHSGARHTGPLFETEPSGPG